VLAIAVLVAILSASASPARAVERVSNLSYISDGDDKHKLDLYLPPDREHAALVVFVHGGAFLQGDRRDYESVGYALAREGLATAIVSYRLSPQTDAAGSTQDVASAIAWTLTHAADYKLDRRNLFLAGHSAGAQIVALIATNAQYLERAGVPFTPVRGVFAIAGAYDVRDLSGEPSSWQTIDARIYGSTVEQRGAVSPSLHIDPRTPATAVACGSLEEPGSCSRAIAFASALLRAGRAAAVFKVVGADHMGTLRSFTDPKDPLNIAFLKFIEEESI
jgi:acetyl esterase/lipase